MTLKNLTKKERIAGFNPNGIGLANNGIFGLPFEEETADTIIFHAPRDVTVSSGVGTSANLDVLLDASLQVDLHDDFNPGFRKDGIALTQLDLLKINNGLRKNTETYLDFLAQGGDVKKNPQMQSLRSLINDSGKETNAVIKQSAIKSLKQKKMVALLGGDHSTSLGIIQAQAEMHNDGFGILHLDAHADLRDAYEGFTYSHASVMFNALQLPQVKTLVQVGVRDYCEAEEETISQHKVKLFKYRDLEKDLFQGKNRDMICTAIIKALPQNVYISFDIDVLDPSLCPHTGTPVPGGLSYYQSVYLIEKLVTSGKRIIGFDLVEVGNDPWDANVGARLLYKFCACMHKSQRK